MAEQCPYFALCSRETTITPDKRTAAIGVLKQAIGGEGVSSIECQWGGKSWESIGTNIFVIPWDDIYPCTSVCEGVPFFEGRIYFNGTHPSEGTIGGMVTADGAMLLNLAVEERDRCLRFQQFAKIGTAEGFKEE